jgi:hypothetical protein
MNTKYLLVENIFKAKMQDARKAGKKVIKDLSDKALKDLEAKLRSDLKEQGYQIESFKISLGSFKGNFYVTSSKLSVRMKANQDANKLLAHLVDVYSPKFKLKSVDGAVANYNIR